jgi:hypothetical protein
MKTLRRLCAVFVLGLALSLSAFAGEMSTSVVSPPPPPSQSITGEMLGGVTGNTSTGLTATDPATDVFLSLLQSLLSLF